MKLPTFIINLDRVPERLEFVLTNCHKSGLSHVTRWPAVDGERLQDYKIENYTPHKGVRWELTNGEIACFESHRRLWQHIIAKGHQRALILEDDIIFSWSFSTILKSLGGADSEYGLIKLDRHNYPTMRHGAPKLTTDDYSLLPVMQQSCSAACYLITLDACKFLVEKSNKYADTIDDFITNPKLDLNVFQLWPAHAVQVQFATEHEKRNQNIPLTFRESELGSNPKLNKRDKGPITYRLNKELKRIGRRFHWWRTDPELLGLAGTIGPIPSGFDNSSNTEYP